MKPKVYHNQAGDLWVNTDKGRVEQVLVVLLEDAILLTHYGGTIDVHLSL